MFESLFLEYKSIYYEYDSKKRTLIERILAWIFLVTIGIVAPYIAFFVKERKYYLIIIFVIFIEMLALLTLRYCMQKKTARLQAKKYKNVVYNVLIELLKSDPYNFYNPKDLDWLIECCKEREPLYKPDNSTIKSNLFSVFSVAFGVFLGGIESQSIIYYAIVIICFLLIFRLINIHILSYYFDVFDNCDSQVNLCLKNDLEKIRADIIVENIIV